MINLTQTAAGTLIPVKANPKAKQSVITGTHDGRLKISITAAPEKGKATDAIVKLLSDALGVPKSSITLHRGATSQLKEFVVTDIAIDVVRQRLNELEL